MRSPVLAHAHNLRACPAERWKPTLDADALSRLATLLRELKPLDATLDDVLGWALLCNGAIRFEDTGNLLPNGQIIAPHRPTPAGAAS
ncbi:DUF5999 family protein [Streptomyces sp. NPDC059568]|uniref:DUF5999 family protein n=1 Tax=Streptomyces sp. NPDC059568 TaxID=3346868 RepID=UPI0036C1A5AA